MRNVKKAFACVTAIAALCTSMSAFAATNFGDTTFGGTFEENGTFTITSLPTDVLAGEPVTLLVLDSTVTDDTSVTAGQIRYIDQTTASAEGYFANSMGMKMAESETKLPAGTYKVKFGYYRTVDDAKQFTIKSTTIKVDAAGNFVTLTWGDLNGNGSADGTDAVLDMLAQLNKASAQTITGDAGDVNVTAGVDTFSVVGLEDKTLTWGDLNGNGSADGTDAVLDMLAQLNKASAQTFFDGAVTATAGVTQVKVDLLNKTIEFLADSNN